MYAEIDRLLKKGFIEVSSSPFCAPCFFVDKKDGSLRMVVDYRQLNKGTKRQHTPLPRIDDTQDMLWEAKSFSSLDLHSGYHQIRINPSDVEKNGFRTPFGQYNFNVLAFRLTNAPATFQAVMNKIFDKYIGKFVLVYLDDILIYSKSYEEHLDDPDLDHIQIVLQLLREHKLYAKLKKCSFVKKWTLFLGHLVGADGIRVDSTKVQAVLNWIHPTDVTQVRSFLGLTNYFRRFI
jgi:Reverse transcriptase (RNA-dependent DNA polymerase)